MKKVTVVGHQGDCLLFRIDEIPEGKTQQDTQCKQKILAYGEATGHCHMITSPSTEVFKILEKAYEGLMFFKSNEPISIKHGLEPGFTGVEADQDYHNEVILPPGNYFTGIVKETDHIGLVSRRVVD